MIRDPHDRRRPERAAAGFVASVLIHALLALFLFSLPSSTSEESSPESFSGTTIVSVSQQQAVKKSAPVATQQTAPPVPHAPVVPRVRVAAAQPRAAQPHPRVLHELAKFAPTAPPNPTPAPVASAAPNPAPTQAVIAVSPAPIEPVVPTTAPANLIAAAVRVPPTAPPQPKPKIQATVAPTHAPAPSAAPKAVATLRPLASAKPLATPGAPLQTHAPNPAPTAGTGQARTPGPKAQGTPGPQGIAPSKNASAAKPIQVAPTPKPERTAARPRSVSKSARSLNQRLNSLIPTAAPSFTPGARKHYSLFNMPKPTPEPEPTPPPQVIAATHFIYFENIGGQKWKQSFLGTAPEEGYVKMYVTAVHYTLGVRRCTGWVVRAPLAGNEKFIVEENASYICTGHLEPFTPPPPEATKGS
jgi:hypothetical protein